MSTLAQPTAPADNPAAPLPTTVGELVRTQPNAVRVLQRYGIDFCCGGGKLLVDVCAKLGVSVDALLAEVAAERGHAPNWDALATAELTVAIVERFHEPLTEELPRLIAMADRVLAVHGDKDPQRLTALNQVVHALVDDLVPHMFKEERVLFPLLNKGVSAGALPPIRVMFAEHDTVGDLLRQLRVLTDEFVPPVGACSTWRALYQGLAELERDTHEHIHVENNVLFARILAESKVD